jgi:hypothetical protein
MRDESNQKPPISRVLLSALKSRRVVVALAALVVGLLMLAAPDLQPLHDEVLVLVITIFLTMVSGYSVEEAARLGRERATLPPEAMRDLLKDLLGGMIDELADRHYQKLSAGDERRNKENE